MATIFTGRILDVDCAVADPWGRLVGSASRLLPATDSFLAATTLEKDLVPVSRNVNYLADLSVQVFIPGQRDTEHTD